jgi:arylsulfatase A-like enzyme
MFIHFDNIDHAGHGFGWGSPQYYKAVEMADSLIAAVRESVRANGVEDRTIFLVTADHGGKGTKHGGATLEELEIPWIIVGPGVARGKELKKPVNTYDTAATLAHIFGLQAPECWLGKPVLEAFDGLNRNPQTTKAGGGSP